MKSHTLSSVLFTGLLLIGSTASVGAQTDTEDHDAHHAGETQAVPTPVDPGDAPTAGGPGNMQGMMGMMSPEMMQRMMTFEMMQMMHRIMTGQGGTQNLMEQGQMPMAGGTMMCPMLTVMEDSAVLYGIPQASQEEMTPERVRTLLEERLILHGNPRLTIGEITTSTDGSITAEIVTVDGSLVQKLAFNRYPGLVRQIIE